MNSQTSIADLHLFDLEGEPQRLTLLRASDHLLRSFGELEIRTMKVGEESEPRQVEAGDVFCFVLEGAVRVTLKDQREQSPSYGVEVGFDLAKKQPQGLLIPFGVKHVFAAKEDSRVLLLSTHSAGDA